MICNKCGQGVSDGVATYWRMMNFTFCPHCVQEEVKNPTYEGRGREVLEVFNIGMLEDENEVQER